MPAPVPQYVRNAEFVSVVDGDTFYLRLDHGKYPATRSEDTVDIRLNGVNCPELSEPGGAEARDFTHDTLASARQIVTQTYYGSFARTVADVWVDGVSLASVLVAGGYAQVVTR